MDNHAPLARTAAKIAIATRDQIPLDLITRTKQTIAVTGAIGTMLALAVVGMSTLGWVSLTATLSIYALVGFLVTRFVAWSHPHPDFGLPNLVTLIRAVLTAIVAGYTIEISTWSLAPSHHLAWSFAAIATIALLLDGLDGYLARTIGPKSDFGARFDMEVDALLVLTLSVLAIVLGKAPFWAIAIGLIRYGFVAAAIALPWLNAPLAVSLRRKSVCVLQVVCLCLLATPPVSGDVAHALAALALVAVVWSFAIDIAWLYRHRHVRS